MNPLPLLRLVPVSAWAIAAAMAWGALQRHEAKVAGARAVTAERALAQIQADAAQLAIQTAARTAAAHREIAHAASIEAKRGRASAAAASAAVGRLLQRAQAGAGGAACAAAAEGGAASGAAGMVPTDVLRSVAEAAGRLADRADAAMTAGKACERAYDALTR